MPDIFNAATETPAPSVTPAPVAKPPTSVQAAEQVEDQLMQQNDAAHKQSKQYKKYVSLFDRVQPSKNPLAAFVAEPAKTYFESQADEERLLLLLRQHIVTQVLWIIVATVLLFLPLVFTIVPLLSFLPIKIHTIFFFGWYLFVSGFILEKFLDWYFNVCLVSDERIIDVSFVSLLFKHVSYAQIEKIEDVTATTKGILGAVFDFGNLEVQTAGAKDRFEFINIPHPSQVAEFINQMLVEEERHTGTSTPAGTVEEEHV